MRGRIKKHLEDRFFFFIERDDARPNIFAHGRAALDGFHNLTVGARVEFDVDEDPQGRPCAVNVRLISDGQQEEEV